MDVYELVKFLYKNQSEVVRDDATKEWSRAMQIKDPEALEYLKSAEEKRQQAAIRKNSRQMPIQDSRQRSVLRKSGDKYLSVL